MWGIASLAVIAVLWSMFRWWWWRLRPLRADPHCPVDPLTEWPPELAKAQQVLHDNLGWVLQMRTQVDAVVWARFQYFLAAEGGWAIAAMVVWQLPSGFDLPWGSEGRWLYLLFFSFIGLALSLARADCIGRGDRALHYWMEQTRRHHNAYLRAAGHIGSPMAFLAWADIDAALHRHRKKGEIEPAEGEVRIPLSLARFAYASPQLRLSTWGAILCEAFALGWFALLLGGFLGLAGLTAGV